MAEAGGPSGVGSAAPLGHVVAHPGDPAEAVYPLVDRLFVGRECSGVDEGHRILLENDLAVSRNHLEFRVDPERRRAEVVDMSTNGVRINGVRIERAVGVPLQGGERIQVGSHVLEFRSATSTVKMPARSEHRATISSLSAQTMALVAGDLINFSTVSQEADQVAIAEDVYVLYQRLRELLADHRGTLVDYVGDAFFASWELDADPEAVENALRFALAADRLVTDCTAALKLRYADGSQLRMGWGITRGQVTMQLMPGSVVMVIGDAVNVAFRLASIAGREHRPSILAIEAVRESVQRSPFEFGASEDVAIKGRVGTERIYGISPPPQ